MKKSELIVPGQTGEPLTKYMNCVRRDLFLPLPQNAAIRIHILARHDRMRIILRAAACGFLQYPHPDVAHIAGFRHE